MGEVWDQGQFDFAGVYGYYFESGGWVGGYEAGVGEQESDGQDG